METRNCPIRSLMRNVIEPPKTNNGHGRHANGNGRPSSSSRPHPPVTSNAQPGAPTGDVPKFLEAPRVKKSRWFNLRNKIVAPAILLIMIGGSAVYLTLWLQANKIDANQLHVLATSARGIQERVDRFLFERYGDVQAFALNPMVHRDLSKLTDEERSALTQLFNNYVATYGCYAASIVLDPAGKIVAISTITSKSKPLPAASTLVGRDLSSAAWFQKAKAEQYTTYNGEAALTGTVVEDAAADPLIAQIYGSAAPPWTMSFTAPIRDAQGTLYGYWHNVFAPEAIEEIVLHEYSVLKSRGLPSTELCITRGDGVVLVDVDPTETGKLECRHDDVLKFNMLVEKDELALAAKDSSSTEGIATARSARMKILQPGGFARSTPVMGYAGSGTFTFARAEAGELFASTNHLKVVILIVSVIIIGVGVVGLTLVARPIVRAINNVKAGIEAVATGDLRDHELSTPNDETAEIAAALIQARQGMRTAVGKDQLDWGDVTRQRQEAARLTSVVENAPINIMVADENMRITYINPASRSTLQKIAKFLPISPDQIVGQSIDIFHKNPAHQRQVLANPSNFPIHAQFQLGTEVMKLEANAVLDAEGRYLGPMVTWELVTDKIAAAEREKQMTENLKQTLDTVSQNAQALASASEELSATAQQMSSNSEETSSQSNVAAAAAEEVSKNVATVATSAEEMSASVREIAKNATEAAKVATQAVTVAEDTNRTVSKLGESSVEIGKVIKVITSIAQQTNLLALNATIEAARAGEAGKGFAVVANEVKELAKQTASATEEISAKIEAIQGDTKGAVQAISQISGIINQINDISNSIASAVEEQTATTNEIARNASEAARGSTEIAKNITSVSQAAHSTSEGAANTLTASGELARLAAELKKVVDASKD